MANIYDIHTKTNLRCFAQLDLGEDINDNIINAYIKGCEVGAEQIDIDTCWEDLTYYEQERFIDEHKDEFVEEFDINNIDIEDIWKNISVNEQIKFLCKKLNEYFPHEIVRYCKNKEIIKNLYFEMYGKK